jgi:hypothetical protein
MLPMAPFRSRVFSAGNAAAFFLFAANLSSVFVFAQFLQNGLGHGPLAAGLWQLPPATADSAASAVQSPTAPCSRAAQIICSRPARMEQPCTDSFGVRAFTYPLLENGSVAERQIITGGCRLSLRAVPWAPGHTRQTLEDRKCTSVG